MVAVCYADGSHAKAIGVINSETLELTLIYETEIKKKGIRPGIYEHFKKGRYDVLGVITRKHVPFVVYKALYVDKHYGSHQPTKGKGYVLKISSGCLERTDTTKPKGKG